MGCFLALQEIKPVVARQSQAQPAKLTFVKMPFDVFLLIHNPILTFFLM
jgi:hypothetical protein